MSYALIIVFMTMTNNISTVKVDNYSTQSSCEEAGLEIKTMARSNTNFKIERTYCLGVK